MAEGFARVGDIVTGYCNGPGHIAEREFTGVFITGSGICTLDDVPLVMVGDVGTTDCGHTFFAATGSAITSSEGIQAVRVGDICITEGDGVGVVITGSEIVSGE